MWGGINCNGSLRHVKFVYFLLKNYFSLRDKLVSLEAISMERMIRNEKEPDQESLESLQRTCNGTIQELSKEWKAVI